MGRSSSARTSCTCWPRRCARPARAAAACCWSRARRGSASPAWSPPPAPSSRRRGGCSSGYCDDLATARPLGPFRDLSGAVGVALRRALPRGEDREALLRALWAELDSAAAARRCSRSRTCTGPTTPPLDVLRLPRAPHRPAARRARPDLPRRRAGPRRHRCASCSGRPPPRPASAGCRWAAVGPRRRAAVRAGGRRPGRRVRADRAATRSSSARCWRRATATRCRRRSSTPSWRGSAASSRPPATPLEQLPVVPATAERALVEALLPGGLAAVLPAEERGLLSVRSGGVAFRHELTRRAVADALPGARRALLEGPPRGPAPARPRARPAGPPRGARGRHRRGRPVRPAGRPRRGRAGAHREAAAHFALALEHAASYGPAERADLLEGSALAVYARWAAGGTRWPTRPSRSACGACSATPSRSGRRCAGCRGSAGGTAAARRRRSRPSRPSRCSRPPATGACWRWRTATAPSWTCSPTATTPRSPSAPARSTWRARAATRRRSPTPCATSGARSPSGATRTPWRCCARAWRSPGTPGRPSTPVRAGVNTVWCLLDALQPVAAAGCCRPRSSWPRTASTWCSATTCWSSAR